MEFLRLSEGLSLRNSILPRMGGDNGEAPSASILKTTPEDVPVSKAAREIVLCDEQAWISFPNFVIQDGDQPIRNPCLRRFSWQSWRKLAVGITRNDFGWFA